MNIGMLISALPLCQSLVAVLGEERVPYLSVTVDENRVCGGVVTYKMDDLVTLTWRIPWDLSNPVWASEKSLPGVYQALMSLGEYVEMIKVTILRM